MIEILEKKIDELYRKAQNNYKTVYENGSPGGQALAGRVQALHEVLALIRELKPEHYRGESPGYIPRTNDPIGEAAKARQAGATA
jgi:hypothetical protein